LTETPNHVTELEYSTGINYEKSHTKSSVFYYQIIRSRKKEAFDSHIRLYRYRETFTLKIRQHGPPKLWYPSHH